MFTFPKKPELKEIDAAIEGLTSWSALTLIKWDSWIYFSGLSHTGGFLTG